MVISKDNGTIIYRWIIGLMVGVMVFFMVQAHKKLDMVYDYMIENKYVIREIVDEETVDEVRRHELEITQMKVDIKELQLQENQSYVQLNRNKRNVKK